MDHARLAQETVEKLAPYLKELMDKQLPDSGVPNKQTEALQLWKLIYPKIALRFGVISAIQNTIEDNSAANRAAFAQQLTQLYRTNEHIAAQVREIIRTRPRLKKEEKAAPPPSPPDYFSQARAGDREFSAEQISCQECGGKDETLRLVSYPFVISVIFITFRRVFQGVYCAKHANRFYFLALLLTLSIGWIGIPFGFLFTPLTLLSLLTVDKKLRPANARLLLEIVKTKMEAGEMETAATYLRESLWLEDTPETRIEAQKLAGVLKPTPQPSRFSQLVTLLFNYLTVWVMGILIGMIDGIVSLPLSKVDGSFSFLAVIFSYIPLILFILYGSYVAARLGAEAAQRAVLRSKWSGYLLAILLSLGAVYAALTGRFLFNNLLEPQQGQSIFQIISYYGGLIINGGWRMVYQVLTVQNTSSLVFVVFVLLGGVLFLWNIRDHIAQTGHWLAALDEITGTPSKESGIQAVLITAVVLTVFSAALGAIFSLSG